MVDTTKIISLINNALEKNHCKFKVNQSNLDKNLKETGIDSITVMTIVTEIEEHFAITLADEELMKLKTSKDLISLVEKTLKEKK